MKYFQNGFYDSEIHGEAIPAGAFPIGDDYYRELLEGQAAGKRIVTSDVGLPLLADPPAPARAELLAAARDAVDAATDARILAGFEFNNSRFKLSLENQFNYKTECEMAEALSYPHRIKSIDGYYELADADEYRQLYLAAMAWIRAQLEAGWAAKDGLELLTDEELIHYLEGVTQ